MINLGVISKSDKLTNHTSSDKIKMCDDEDGGHFIAFFAKKIWSAFFTRCVKDFRKFLIIVEAK